MLFRVDSVVLHPSDEQWNVFGFFFLLLSAYCFTLTFPASVSTSSLETKLDFLFFFSSSESAFKNSGSSSGWFS